MKSILDYISEETNGKNHKLYKYCFENVEVPKLEYDDKQGIKVEKSWEMAISVLAVPPISVKLCHFFRF